MSSKKKASRVLAILVVVALAILAMAQAAAAKNGGQLESWGAFGTGNGQFNTPFMLGVDSADGTVYAGDVVNSKNDYRIQRLSATGTYQASVQIPRFAAANVIVGLHGIAVDPVLDRIYVVESCKVTATLLNCKATGSLYGAKQIRVYSTNPVGGALVPDPTTPAIALPEGANELYFPQSIAVDPASHDVVLLAEDSGNRPVIQRFSSSGAAGARFVDTEKKLRPAAATRPVSSRDATSLVVSPAGVTYTMTGNSLVNGGARAWQLPADLSKVDPVPGFAAAAEAEAWEAPLMASFDEQSGSTQLALSPDGGTLYWKEKITGSEPTEAGTMLVRGFSLSGSKTSSLWGSGSATCKVTTNTAGLAAGASGKLVVFDFGPNAEPPGYGNKVVTFGPSGTGCPEPKAKFTVNGKTEAETVPTINPGDNVSFNAASSELLGGFRRELIWKWGDGQEKSVKYTPGAEGDTEAITTATHAYASGGTYTVRLEIKLSAAYLGNPDPVERTFVVGSPTPSLKLKVNKGGTGGGTVTSTPSGISCGATCEANFNEGSSVTLAGAPNANSKAVVWSGCGEIVNGNDCKVTMSAAKEVTASFDLVQRQLTVNKSGAGTGTITSTPAGINCGATCVFSFNDGTAVTLAGAPGANSQAVVWTGCDEIVGSNECKVTMGSAKTVGASFALVKRQLTVTKGGTGGGTVTSAPAGIDCGATCAFEFDHNTQVTLAGAAAIGSEAVQWSGCDSIVGSNECKVTLGSAKAVTATFNIQPGLFLLKVKKQGSGTSTVTSTPSGINCGATCEVALTENTVVTLEAAPGANSKAVVWTGCGEIVGSNECRVTMTAAKEVTATSDLVQRQLTVTKTGAGSGTVTSAPAGISCGATCSFSFEHGTAVTLTATPASGSEFKGWSGAGCPGTGTCSVTMSAASSVSAEFAPVPVTPPTPTCATDPSLCPPPVEEKKPEAKKPTPQEKLQKALKKCKKKKGKAKAKCTKAAKAKAKKEAKKSARRPQLEPRHERWWD